MQAHKGIEDQQARPQGLDGTLEALAIALEIEPQCRGGDHLHIDCGELAGDCGTDTLEPCAHDVLSVLGGIEQYAAGGGDREAPQRRPPGGDRDGELEGEEALATLRFPADDADGPFAPEIGDEPALRFGLRGQAVRGLDRQGIHRLRPASFKGTAAAADAVKVSKNNCSSIWRASRWAATVSSSPAMFIRARRLPCA